MVQVVRVVLLVLVLRVVQLVQLELLVVLVVLVALQLLELRLVLGVLRVLRVLGLREGLGLLVGLVVVVVEEVRLERNKLERKREHRMMGKEQRTLLGIAFLNKVR